MRGITVAAIILLFAYQTQAVFAVEVNPSEESLTQAIEEGKKSASFIAYRFGNPEQMCSGWGIIQTKLWNVRTASMMNEKKLKPTTSKEIDSILSYKTLLITYTLCTGDQRASDHHMVLKQGEKVIQPVELSVSQPEVLSSSTFLFYVKAYFQYGTFDPAAETTIIVIPDRGEKREYPLKLSDFP